MLMRRLRVKLTVPETSKASVSASLKFVRGAEQRKKIGKRCQARMAKTFPTMMLIGLVAMGMTKRSDSTAQSLIRT